MVGTEAKVLGLALALAEGLAVVARAGSTPSARAVARARLLASRAVPVGSRRKAMGGS